jgi:hypothetical protein
MFAEFSQLISCENSAKSRIRHDHASARARASPGSLRTALTALTVITHH